MDKAYLLIRNNDSFPDAYSTSVRVYLVEAGAKNDCMILNQIKDEIKKEINGYAEEFAYYINLPFKDVNTYFENEKKAKRIQGAKIKKTLEKHKFFLDQEVENQRLQDLELEDEYVGHYWLDHLSWYVKEIELQED